MVSPRRMLRTGALCLSVQLAGCAVYTLPGAEPPPERPPESPAPAPLPSPQPSPAPPARPAPPAVDPAAAAYGPLLQRAQAATDRGDYEEALGLLERAQRIAPDSAEVYLALARTHAARGDQAAARATAERGLLYCEGSAQCTALRGYTR